jgi:hypothetical protein
VGHGGAGCNDDDDDDACPLLDLIKRHPDLFEKEVLQRLDRADRAFLGQVNSRCRAAVVASDLPCAGLRVGMQVGMWHLKPAERARGLARMVREFTPYSTFGLGGIETTYGNKRDYSPALVAYLGREGYVEASDAPRAGWRAKIVRLELDAFCTSAGRLAWAKVGWCKLTLSNP